MTDWDKHETIGFVRYGYWYNTLNSTAFRRIDFVLNFIQLMLGSAVIASVAGDSSAWTVFFGFCVTAITIVSALIGFGSRKEHFKHAATAYNQLLGELEEFSERDAKKRLQALQSAFDRGFECADYPAHNRVCDMHERPDLKVQLDGWQKWRAILLFGNH